MKGKELNMSVKKVTYPKYKRLKRKDRLEAGKAWLPKYTGNNAVIGYSKHFGVNKLCAALELQMLGYQIPKEQLEKLKAEEMRIQKTAEKRKLMKKSENNDDIHDSDETFYYIAGYTSNGTPYGLTWDEVKNSSNIDD